MKKAKLRVERSNVDALTDYIAENNLTTLASYPAKDFFGMSDDALIFVIAVPDAKADAFQTEWKKYFTEKI